MALSEPGMEEQTPRQVLTPHLVRSQEGGLGDSSASLPAPRDCLTTVSAAVFPFSSSLCPWGPRAGGGGCSCQRKPAVGTRQVGGGGVPRYKQDSPHRLSAQAPGPQVGAVPESQLRSTAGEGLSGVLKGDWTWSGVLGPHPESQGGPDEVREMLSFCPMPILASAPTDAFALGPRKGNPSLAPGPDTSALTSCCPHARDPAGSNTHHQSAGLSAGCPPPALAVWSEK